MMKLILFLMIVLFKCSRLSSTAPTETSRNRNNSEDFSLNDLSNAHESSSPNVLYTENDDYGKSGVVYEFRRSIKNDNKEIEARRRSAVDKGFMRFGRSKNMLRFGRSEPDATQYDNEANYIERDDNEINEPYSMRMRKANGMLRFGRNNLKGESFQNYLANRDESRDDDSDYNNDASEVFDLVDLPVRRNFNNNYDEHGKKILRLGRSSSESYSDESVDDFEKKKEKRLTDKNLLRFGRTDKNMMRFGRGNMMRFGRAGENFMKTDNNDYLRDARAGNVMRFGRAERNPMRFGKRNGGPQVSSSSRIYCEDGKCLIQQKENRLIDENDKKILSNEIYNKDQLNSLFGEELKQQQGYGEYVLKK
ncbi:hypothetical protein PVAND_010073 [Polypedilum vanderplanki]|uniref:Uncharacterized protein n=1 Tax=Polypedilum vanderplanki TaxID=319348 RepID=A0A9J6CFJ2_POLVA|nr:hypothetical protein PVAND_010073 [Polypedilum vanderplanki]